MIVNRFPHIHKLFKDKVQEIFLSVQKLDKDISSFRAIGLSNEVTVAYGHKVISSFIIPTVNQEDFQLLLIVGEFILKLDSCRGGRG